MLDSEEHIRIQDHLVCWDMETRLRDLHRSLRVRKRKG